MGEPDNSSAKTAATTNTNTTTTPIATPEPQLKAAKDKNCPFCGQAFTSSSLGRHLDLYIRPKNPKAPDGIHLVDEIRKLRGGITRRQAKASVSGLKKDDSSTSTPAGKKQSSMSEDATLVQSPEEDDDDDDDAEGLQVGKARGPFKDVNWGRSDRRPSRALGASRQMQKAELDQRQKAGEDSEIATATEMALRELLRSVRDANAKASGSSLFDFDPYALNFPSLCLHILSAPPTLFSPTPFPTPESWAVTPPGQKQFDALNKQVRERLLAQQRQRQINQAFPSGTRSTASSANSSPLPTPPLFDPDPQKLFCHIADSYNHWSLLSDKSKQECWQLEVLRCFARAEDRRCEAEVQLENARREIEYLKSTRWSSGQSDFSPVTINLGTDTAKELARYGMDFRNWDYDRLIDKWRNVIRDNRAATQGMAAQKPLPGGQPTTRNCSMASLAPHAFPTAHLPRTSSPMKADAMPFTAPPTVVDEATDEHLDAEGDDDEDIKFNHPHSDESMVQQPAQTMLQPQQQRPQHIPIQPTPVHPSQQLQPHLQSQMMMNNPQAQMQAMQSAAQAQVQAWAAARQHMNQSRNQNFSPHQHQQMSPHVQHVQSHMGSAASSRRPSLQFNDPHAMNNAAVAALTGQLGMATGMEGIETSEQFLRLDMSMTGGYVGGPDGGVSLG